VANGELLPAEGVVVRRFDPTDDKHWASDDEDGAPRLRSSAFHFDNEAQYGVMGCSVFHEAKLVHSKGDRWSCLEPDRPTFRIATAKIHAIRSASRANVTPADYPFDVIEDAYDDEIPGCAHALITHELKLSKPYKWYRELAFAFEAHLEKIA